MKDARVAVWESNSSFDQYAIATKAKLPGGLAPIIIGHLPKEISPITYMYSAYHHAAWHVCLLVVTPLYELL